MRFALSAFMLTTIESILRKFSTPSHGDFGYLVSAGTALRADQ